MIETPVCFLGQADGLLIVNRVRQLQKSYVVAPVGVLESGMNGDLADPMCSIEQICHVQVRVTDYNGNVTCLLVVDAVGGCQDEVLPDESSGTEVEAERIQQTCNPRE